MGKKCLKIWGYSVFLVALYIMVVNGLVFGQVTPGTVSSKTLDGVGNKITSTASGVKRGLDVNIISSSGNTVASANNDGTCPSGAASFTVVASNTSRTWLAMWASPANTDDVFIKLGATATNADGRLAPGQSLNITSGRIYTGVVDAFPNSGTQAVCVMELN